MKVKGLSLTWPEFRGKRVPESRNRGRNVMSLLVPLQTQKSQGENPNLTGKVTVGQIWFRLSLRLGAGSPDDSELSPRWLEQASNQ